MFMRIRIIRPVNCLMSIIAVFISILIAAGDFSNLYSIQVLIALFLVFIITAAGNMLNDYTDRDIDMVSHPDRVIPRGGMKPRSVLTSSIALFTLSFILSLSLNPISTILVAINIAAMISYELKIKRTKYGNPVVAYLVGSLFLFGGAVMNSFRVVPVLFLLATLSNFSRELVKDIQDLEGDIGERKTIPMIYGEETARRLAMIPLAIAIFISPLPAKFLGRPYLYIVVVADILFIYSILNLKNPEKSSRMMKIAMLIALLAFLAGRLGCY